MTNSTVTGAHLFYSSHTFILYQVPLYVNSVCVDDALVSLVAVSVCTSPTGARTVRRTRSKTPVDEQLATHSRSHIACNTKSKRCRQGGKKRIDSFSPVNNNLTSHL